MSVTVDAESLSVAARPPAPAPGAVARYAYRLLARAELPLLNDLYNENYRCRRPVEEAEWLYARNPNGSALIYGAFDENGALAGMRPAIPFQLYWRGESRVAYEFADALVSVRHRGRGIFSHLVKQICAHAEREDFTLYSIPNENSLPVYRRSRQLRVLGATQTRVRPLAWGAYLAQRMGWSGRARAPAQGWEAGACDGVVTLEPVGGFESDFEEVHAELGRRFASFTRRTRAYLQWRYFGSPVRVYRVALVRQQGRVRGYLALRLVDGIAHLVDVFIVPDPALARRVFRLAAAWAEGMGAVGVHFNASRGNCFHAAAARSGYWLSKRSGSLVVDRRTGELLESRQSGPLGQQDTYFVMGDFDFL